MMEIVSREQCTGCMLCVEVCPYHAVRCSDKAKNGYYYSVIDQTKCMDCGLCKSKCPQCRNGLYTINGKDPVVYLAWARDSDIRRSSSSGGVFSVLAEYFLSIGGVVIGAAYNVDFSVSHIAVESRDDLHRLRLSKYVQSDTSTIWKKVKQYVNSNRPVLFSGVPCQVDALNCYFDELPDNLYTIDLLCHGVPSPVLWQEYLASIRNKWGEQITYINYRHKSGFGWTQRKVAIGFQDGRMYLSTKSEDPFARLFLEDIAIRESCFECRYSDKKRVSDLTLGDFWALENSTIKNKEQGLSMMLCNSIKGQDLLNKVRRKLIIEKIQNVDIGLNTVGLGKKLLKVEKYDRFWSEYNIFGFSYALNNYLNSKSYNHSLDIYKKISFLSFYNIHIADIFYYMELDNVYLYGAGEMGKMLLSDLCGKVTVSAVFDRKVEEDTHIHVHRTEADGEKREFIYPLLCPKKIPDDDGAIIITPAQSGSAIIDLLYEKGISKKRLITLNVLLDYGIFYWKELIGKEKECKFPQKEFLIIGDRFKNIDTQSMLFVAVSEIRKRFRNAVIWFCGNVDRQDYRNITDKYKLLFLSNDPSKESVLYEIMPRLEGIIDISDYASSSIGPDDKINRVISLLISARSFKIPVFLMPQSIDVYDCSEFKRRNIEKILSYADVILVRENSEYKRLIDNYTLTNVKYSGDLILQNKNVNPKYIYTDRKSKEIHLPLDANVALIPDIQIDRSSNRENVLKLYTDIIDLLLSMNKAVYIISLFNDEGVCNDIYEKYHMNKKVHLYGGELDCLDFSNLLMNFQYVICSQYHAVIYSYKRYTPCVVIEGEEKCKEILECFGQERYFFDARNHTRTAGVLEAIQVMEYSCKEESAKIEKNLHEVQRENCFDVLEV